MGQVLGLDLGTNSIGWAIVDEMRSNHIMSKGVVIFQEGVKIEKGVESSKAAERTSYRLARRMKFRRRLRKYETLKVLIANAMCPLTREELNAWVVYKKGEKRQYPKSELFLDWLKTDDVLGRNPYALRAMAAEGKIPPYELGRAFYHLAQRRGFLSNRKEGTKESEGEVRKQIDELTTAKGDLTLGQYFNQLYQQGVRIRGRYTSRKYHYMEEFEKICAVQELSPQLHDELVKALFFQRKLRSQRQLVGKCTFEPKKSRCPISHYEFEEFRMWQFLNSVWYRKESTAEKQFLTNQEKSLVIPKFFRKSKPTFGFEDIRKILTPKGQEYIFNYKDKDTVSGCPVSAGLLALFGEDWRDIKIPYQKKDGSDGIYDISDIWHVLYNFDDDDKLAEFAQDRLGLIDADIKAFLSIPVHQGYASLSLCAIRKILPFLKHGIIYSHAVFLANIGTIVDKNEWENAEIRRRIIDDVQQMIEGIHAKNFDISVINAVYRDIGKNPAKPKGDPLVKTDLPMVVDICKDYYGSKSWEGMSDIKQQEVLQHIFHEVNFLLENINVEYSQVRIDEEIIAYLHRNYKVNDKKDAVLYHPSDIELFKRAEPSDDGKCYLGSPAIPSVKNPMAMRSLYQLRKLINYLIKEDYINADTPIHVELANELNDMNKRAAIRRYQQRREQENNAYKERIQKEYKEYFNRDIEPSDGEILKYRLWEEQKHICMYTGKNIGISDFLGGNTACDLEHTIPRSYSYDDSQENLTLCDTSYNRNVKKQFLPTELPDYEMILKRAQECYKLKVDSLDSQIRKVSDAPGVETKESKDKRIQQRNFLKLERNYWWQKYWRFTIEEITEGFKNSQLNDTRLITKYALQYLRSVFGRVQPVKGLSTDRFRKLWGLQAEDEKKNRDTYVNHTVDAIVVACISKKKYDILAQSIRENGENGIRKFPLPWDGFGNDVKNCVNEVLVKHNTYDRVGKPTKKKLRIRGKVQFKDPEAKTEPIYIQGDTARGPLHRVEIFGAIIAPSDPKDRQKVRYVIRKSIDALEEKDIKNIVDIRIQELFLDAIAKSDLATVKRQGICIPSSTGVGSGTPIKKIRLFASQIANPIVLRTQRDKSSIEYKQYVYVVNDSNYLMALYTGKNDKGRDFFLVNNLDATNPVGEMYPLEKIKKGVLLQISGVLRKGVMVLLYKDKNDDVWRHPELLSRRLYKIEGFTSFWSKGNEYGCINLRYHMEARQSKDLNKHKGAFSIEEEPFCLRMLLHTQFNALIEGKDFIITPAGVVQRM
ncbi:MAG: type II CRISPR RNA-guided endonuclease Cas9 [Sphaerochaetaceae bacterium]